MANILNSNNGVSKIVAVLILLIATAVLVFPVVKDLGNPVEKTDTYTIVNEGVPFAIADSGIHTITMSTDGTVFTVTVDSNPVSTAGLGTYRSVSVEDATSSIILVIGSDALLKLYDSGDAIVYTTAGSVNLGKATSPISLTIDNGTMAYTGGSITVSLYRANAGDYVLANAPVKVLNDATVYFADYGYGIATVEDTVGIGYAGEFNASALTGNATLISPISILAPSNVPVLTDATVTNIADDSIVTISAISFVSQYLDVDSSTVSYGQMFAPATANYERTVTEPAGGIVYDIVKFMPIILIICLFASFVVPMVRR